MFKSYKKVPHLSKRNKEILYYFSEDINATIASKLSNVNKNYNKQIYLGLHKIIARYCEENSIFATGEIERVL